MLCRNPEFTRSSYSQILGCSRKDSYSPPPPPPHMEEINNTPSPSLDILYKFKNFLDSSSPPFLDGGNFLCGWGMDPFWNGPLPP